MMAPTEKAVSEGGHWRDSSIAARRKRASVALGPAGRAGAAWRAGEAGGARTAGGAGGAGAQQVAQRDHAAEPLHAGQRHGVRAVRGVVPRQRERRRARLPHEERRHGQVQLIREVLGQKIPQQDRAAFEENPRHGAFGQIGEREGEGGRVTGVNDLGPVPQPRHRGRDRRAGAVDQAAPARPLRGEGVRPLRWGEEARGRVEVGGRGHGDPQGVLRPPGRDPGGAEPW